MRLAREHDLERIARCDGSQAIQVAEEQVWSFISGHAAR